MGRIFRPRAVRARPGEEPGDAALVRPERGLPREAHPPRSLPGIKGVRGRARVVTERRLNDLINSTHNKGSALFSTSAIHLDHLLRKYGDKGLVIFCDRQGGRAHYSSLLRLMFDEWSLEILHEEEARAEQRLLPVRRQVQQEPRAPQHRLGVLAARGTAALTRVTPGPFGRVLAALVCTVILIEYRVGPLHLVLVGGLGGGEGEGLGQLVQEAGILADVELERLARQAEEFGDKGMVVQLEDIVNDETGHKEETERLLRDWPL